MNENDEDIKFKTDYRWNDSIVEDTHYHTNK
jgi:hypothetical protein